MSNSEKMKVQFFQLKSSVLILAVVWTIIFAVSLAWNMVEIEYNAPNSARIQARAAYKKDILYRRWNASHGGVYVPVTKKTQPNPYLSGIPERDITTPSGRKLTLMNPAYMTRQVHELAKEEYGVLGHITSLNPIRPQNAPDPWEIKALEEFERGPIEVSSAEKIEGKEFMRLMRPLITERGCLKCHAAQGYEEGDIRGGISVSVPMGPLRAIAHKNEVTLVIAHALLWMAGLAGGGLGAWWLKESESKRRWAQEALEKANETLETKVEVRTAELRIVNDRLRTENAERKRTEKDLQQAYANLEKQSVLLAQTEKMSAIGTLVAGTAHELNNPIMGIMNFSAHCIKHTSEQDRIYTFLQDTEREAKHCAEIVRNLLTFSHTEKDDDKAYEKESLAEILGRVLKLLSYRIEKQRILVTQRIADDTPKIWIKPNNIQQLILNLTTNAFDALEESEKKEFNVDIHREGEFVRMTFADTGCGIAAESLTSIFDPFFTTKPVGQGTGLGLSVSQGIVKAHGGEITCESEPGAGTKFIILLPIEKPEVSKRNV